LRGLGEQGKNGLENEAPFTKKPTHLFSEQREQTIHDRREPILELTSPADPTGEAEIAEHERLPPRQLRPERWRLAARDPKADWRRDVTIVEAADAALPTLPRQSGEAMPRGGGLAECEVAAHHKFLSSHEQADRPPAGTNDAARRKPSPARRIN